VALVVTATGTGAALMLVEEVELEDDGVEVGGADDVCDCDQILVDGQ